MTTSNKFLSLVLGYSLLAMASASTLIAAPGIKKLSSKAKPVKKPAAALVVQGKIKAIARTPRPGSVPYKDAVIAIHLAGTKAAQGKLPQGNILIYTWGMRANKLTPAASFKPGQTIKLRLQLWDKVEGKYGRYQRVELDDDNVLTLNTYWGEPGR